MNKCSGFILIFMFCLIGTSCSPSENEFIKTEDNSGLGQEMVANKFSIEAADDNDLTEECPDGILEGTAESAETASVYEKDHSDTVIDYDLLDSMGYEIIEENVLETVTGNVQDHPLLKEALSSSIKDDQLAQQEFGTRPATMEYFVYDINEDGLEDYLVCLSGIVFEGSHGNSFEIYVQENDGSLKQVFSVTSWIHYEEHSHYPIAILDDSNAGYHTFVLPWVNTIWSYDEKDEWYRGRDCRKPTDYDSIFCDAEMIFLEIAKNPNTSGKYANIAAGSWFVQAEDYYYLNPEEYFDSIEIIRGEGRWLYH